MTHSLRSLTVTLCVSLSLSCASRLHAAPAPEKRCPELFLAIGQQDAPGVKALLARGVDPNSQNTLGMSALQAAAATGSLEVLRTLLTAGADVNHSSVYGTPLTFAAFDSKPEVMRLLLERGASVQAPRPDRINVLMLAARAGSAEVIRDLLARGAERDATDNHGSTALSYAAREGKGEAVQALLQAGAKVDAADADGWTPLMHAAVNGHAAVTEQLLLVGANANTRDKQGRTPLLLTANFGDHPEVIRALLKAGADAGAKDAQGRTARGLAQARGYHASARLLQTTGAPKLAGSQAPRTPREAAELSLIRVEHAMQVFAKRTGCVSCHHEGLARLTTGFAQSHGYRISSLFARKQERRVLDFVNSMQSLLRKAVEDPAETPNVPIVDVGDLAPSTGTLLLGLGAHRVPRNEALGAATMVLARTQTPEGDWRFGFVRTPVQSSFFTTTAMAIRAMRTYAPAEHAKEVEARVARAKSWLLTAPTRQTEDRVFRLLGLKWAGASPAERRKAAEQLRAAQRPDGGWAQFDGGSSDAYATGSVLFALNQGGDLPASDPIYQRGVAFLLRTQQDDGTWYVSKRAMPANNYFDAEFPYGQSQYVSHAAACWATMALILADDTAEAPRRAMR